MKLLQGFFRQDGVSHSFFGILVGDGKGNWDGGMVDSEGQSHLFAFYQAVCSPELTFRKQYVRHQLLPHAFIIYFLDREKPDGSLWVGKWRFGDGEWSPEASVACVISDVDEKLFHEDARQFFREFPGGAFDPDIMCAFMERAP